MLPSPAWKTLAIAIPCFRPVAAMNRRMCGSLVRGTTPSCVQNVGLRRPIAPKADFRAFQMAVYSGSLRVRQAIDRLIVPPAPSITAAMSWASRSSPASRPSVSAIRTAPASTGNPRWKAASTARIIGLSIISSAAGTIPAAIIRLTASVAASTVSKTPRNVRPASGSRVRATVTSVTIAERPLVADDQARQVIARGVFERAAGPDAPSRRAGPVRPLGCG